MNIQMGKSSVILLCGVTMIIAVTFLIKYNQRKKKKKKKKMMTTSIESDEIENLINGFDHFKSNITINDDCDNDNDDDILVINKENEANDSMKKSKIEIFEKLIPNEWNKIGEVKELFIYPLKSGRGKNLKESLFTEYGISNSINCKKEEGWFSLMDRMFIVYKEETGEFKTGKNYPTLVLVTLSTADCEKDYVKVEAVGMPSLKFKVPEVKEKGEKKGEGKEKVKKIIDSVPCTLWWGETIQCIDCGTEVSRWISRFLTGTNSGLRLGCCAFDKLKIKETITPGEKFNYEEPIEPWEKFDEEVIEKSFGNKGDIDMASNLASYLVISESSVDALNQNVNRPRSALQFRPNLVVSGPEPFSENDWEWIRIGDNVVMRNVKPYSRAQRDARRIQIAGEPPTAGIYCGIYKTGEVKIGDNVYVNKQQKKLTKSE